MSEPNVLHRYRSFGGRGTADLERTIVQRELYFSAPLKFNDPFDCRPVFSIEATDAETKAYCERVIRKHMPHLNRQQLRVELKAALSDPLRNPRSPKAVAALQALHTKRVTAGVGVLCLSAVPDNILLWAHYADAHQGVCLIFDGNNDFFMPAQDVQYSHARPRINPVRDSEDSMMVSALLTKSDHWAYEEEWRIIHYQSGPAVYRYPVGALLGVILGAQISSSNEQLVRKWVDEAPSSCLLYRGAPSASEFRVDIEPLPP